MVQHLKIAAPSQLIYILWKKYLGSIFSGSYPKYKVGPQKRLITTISKLLDTTFFLPLDTALVSIKKIINIDMLLSHLI